MPVVRAEAARRTSEPGLEAAGLATPSLGARELVLGTARIEPGRRQRPHSHDREEVISVLVGEAVATLDGEEVALRPGDTLIVPPGVVHELVGSGEEPFECLTCEPAEIQFFESDGREREAPEVMR